MLMVSLFVDMPGACRALTIPGGLHADKNLPPQVYTWNKDKPMPRGVAFTDAGRKSEQRCILKQLRSLSPLCNVPCTQ